MTFYPTPPRLNYKMVNIEAIDFHFKYVEDMYIINKYGPLIKLRKDVLHTNLTDEEKKTIIGYIDTLIDWSKMRQSILERILRTIEMGEFCTYFETSELIEVILKKCK